MSARDEVSKSLEAHEMRLAVIEHQLNTLTNGHNTRLTALEKAAFDNSRQLSRIEMRLDEIAPAVMDLKRLMQVWARFQGESI